MKSLPGTTATPADSRRYMAKSVSVATSFPLPHALANNAVTTREGIEGAVRQCAVEAGGLVQSSYYRGAAPAQFGDELGHVALVTVDKKGAGARPTVIWA
jgi:hypothetical protein